MSLTEEFSFGKDGHIERFPLFRKLFLALVITLTALLSFGLGRLSIVGDREPIRIEYDTAISNDEFLISNQTPNTKSQTASAINAVSSGEVVTSKNGSKYHYPDCPGAKQIKAENRLVFPSAAAAQAAGYALAANCSPR